jgi:hypothetical protein
MGIAMNPGISPIYRNPQGTLTNVPPPGNDPGWSLTNTPLTSVTPIGSLFASEASEGGY